MVLRVDSGKKLRGPLPLTVGRRGGSRIGPAEKRLRHVGDLGRLPTVDGPRADKEAPLHAMLAAQSEDMVRSLGDHRIGLLGIARGHRATGGRGRVDDMRAASGGPGNRADVAAHKIKRRLGGEMGKITEKGRRIPRQHMEPCAEPVVPIRADKRLHDPGAEKTRPAGEENPRPG